MHAFMFAMQRQGMTAMYLIGRHHLIFITLHSSPRILSSTVQQSALRQVLFAASLAPVHDDSILRKHYALVWAEHRLQKHKVH